MILLLQPQHFFLEFVQHFIIKMPKMIGFSFSNIEYLLVFSVIYEIFGFGSQRVPVTRPCCGIRAFMYQEPQTGQKSVSE